jgi:hypothetical protein
MPNSCRNLDHKTLSDEVVSDDVVSSKEYSKSPQRNMAD